MKYICRYCGRICKNDNSLRNHERLCKENPDRQILKSNFITWNEFRKGKKLQKPSNQYLKAKELGTDYCISDETRQKLSTKGHLRKSSDETKQKLSKTMKKVAAENKSYSENKSHLTKKSFVNGFRMDSDWEKIFAEYLISSDIKWVKSNKSFKYVFEGEEHSYYPDFYLSEYDRYIEIKGYETEKDLAKYKSVKDLIVLKQNDIKKIKTGEFDIFEYLK